MLAVIIPVILWLKKRIRSYCHLIHARNFPDVVFPGEFGYPHDELVFKKRGLPDYNGHVWTVHLHNSGVWHNFFDAFIFLVSIVLLFLKIEIATQIAVNFVLLSAILINLGIYFLRMKRDSAKVRTFYKPYSYSSPQSLEATDDSTNKPDTPSKEPNEESANDILDALMSHYEKLNLSQNQEIERLTRRSEELDWLICNRKEIERLTHMPLDLRE